MAKDYGTCLRQRSSTCSSRTCAAKPPRRRALAVAGLLLITSIGRALAAPTFSSHTLRRNNDLIDVLTGFDEIMDWYEFMQDVPLEIDDGRLPRIPGALTSTRVDRDLERALGAVRAFKAQELFPPPLTWTSLGDGQDLRRVELRERKLRLADVRDALGNGRQAEETLRGLEHRSNVVADVLVELRRAFEQPRPMPIPEPVLRQLIATSLDFSRQIALIGDLQSVIKKKTGEIADARVTMRESAKVYAGLLLAALAAEARSLQADRATLDSLLQTVRKANDEYSSRERARYAADEQLDSARSLLEAAELDVQQLSDDLAEARNRLKTILDQLREVNAKLDGDPYRLYKGCPNRNTYYQCIHPDHEAARKTFRNQVAMWYRDRDNARRAKATTERAIEELRDQHERATDTAVQKRRAFQSATRDVNAARSALNAADKAVRQAQDRYTAERQRTKVDVYAPENAADASQVDALLAALG